MTKNPIINALCALSYIILIVSIMNLITQTQGSKPDTPFAPMIFLSVFTLSAAIMASLFFYQPLQLFIEGKKKQALDLFVRTVGVFAIITALALILLFSGLL